MRIILYRGKRLYDNKWVYGDLYHRTICGRTSPTIHNIDYSGGSVYPNTIGQYTGIIDKNDNKIFEGDIIKWTRYNFKTEYTPLQNLVHYCVIFYNEKHHAFFMRYKLERGAASGLLNFNDDRCEYSEIEIVGNIYDNPDLLK